MKEERGFWASVFSILLAIITVGVVRGIGNE